MKNIAIIDADLIGRKKHRFPNLVCMKLSSYHKQKDDNVELKLDYDCLDNYDKVYIAKVFTDTPIESSVLDKENVEYGGTGFFYDKAKSLPYEIEHTTPDYDLYLDWVNKEIESGRNAKDYKYYTDYSIGFLTRGCFRKCSFCVNKNYNKVELHSPLSEFLNNTKKGICLLDDNFLGSPKWKELLQELQNTKKKFQFKQGLDERLLTDESCKLLFSSKYDGDYIFAFDNYKDKNIIESKLKLIRKYTNKVPKFYCLCAYDRDNKYDEEFWVNDIKDLFARIEILAKYRCLPYIMRYNKYIESPYKGLYIALANWCNVPAVFKKMSLEEFALYIKNHVNSSAYIRYLNHFLETFPNASYYVNSIRFGIKEGVNNNDK